MITVGLTERRQRRLACQLKRRRSIDPVSIKETPLLDQQGPS
jgi:hypothetical protein